MARTINHPSPTRRSLATQVATLLTSWVVICMRKLPVTPLASVCAIVLMPRIEAIPPMFSQAGAPVEPPYMFWSLAWVSHDMGVTPSAALLSDVMQLVVHIVPTVGGSTAGANFTVFQLGQPNPRAQSCFNLMQSALP